MVKIKINSVEIGAQYDGTIYNFWIKAELEKGLQIEIFDNEPYDLRDKIGSTIECEVSAFLISKTADNTGQNLEGKIEVQNGYPKFISNFGIFRLDKNEIEALGLLKNENICINVGRFDLVSI